MVNLAIYLRLVSYPLLALGLFLLATCCQSDRLERLLYLLLSFFCLLSLVKAFQQLTRPSQPFLTVEWMFSAIILSLIVVVWLEFFHKFKKP